jgi:hypothetical protein
MVLLLALWGSVAEAACTVADLRPVSGTVAASSPAFTWRGSADCTSYRVLWSPSGTFVGDVTSSAWGASRRVALAEDVFDSRVAGPWSAGVSWRVQGRDAAMVTTTSAAVRLDVDPDDDDDGVTVSEGDCDDLDPAVAPGVPDDDCDGFDQDCDGWPDDADGVDVDFDGIADVCDPEVDACAGVWPEVVSVEVTLHANIATAAHLDVTLDTPASLAVACTRDDEPSDVVLFESPDTLDHHTLTVYGLVPAASYTCEVVTVCPSSAAPYPVQVVTRSAGDAIPTATVTVDPTIATTGPPFLLSNYDPFCTGGTPGMVVYDLNGEIRWYYDGIPDIDNAFETQYLGEGLFSWGGGYYNGDPPEIITLDGDVAYRAPNPGRLFHHDGKVLYDGTMMVMTIETNTVGVRRWDGFGLYYYDMDTDTVAWSYSSQRAAMAGDLPSGSGDPWHANWSDLIPYDTGDRVAVSLCNLGDIIAIDKATKDVVWRLGDGGDFFVQDADGNPLSDFDGFSQCQHGLELVGDRLLVYDNGNFGRGYTRISEYELDESTWTATLLWTWTEPVFYESIWGDADYLPGGHVLATMAHVDCWAAYPGDHSSAVEIDPVTGKVPWRLELDDPNDANYRSERVNACDAFPLAGFCPEVDARLDELAPLFDPCGAGLDADLDGDGVSMCSGDCDDRDATVFPGAVDVCDGVDDDCDGVRDGGFPAVPIWVDRDGDGFGAGDADAACVVPDGFAGADGDCDDYDFGAWPGNLETCNGTDDNCDGLVDELPVCYGCTTVGDYIGCSDAVSWESAADLCVAFGASLASIEDATANSAVAAFGGERWIGANDRTSEGTWRWADGSPVSYTQWYSGEPNDYGGNEDCAGINFGATGYWNDYNCSSGLGFVCEL